MLIDSCRLGSDPAIALHVEFARALCGRRGSRWKSWHLRLRRMCGSSSERQPSDLRTIPKYSHACRKAPMYWVAIDCGEAALRNVATLQHQQFVQFNYPEFIEPAEVIPAGWAKLVTESCHTTMVVQRSKHPSSGSRGCTTSTRISDSRIARFAGGILRIRRLAISLSKNPVLRTHTTIGKWLSSGTRCL